MLVTNALQQADKTLESKTAIPGAKRQHTDFCKWYTVQRSGACQPCGTREKCPNAQQDQLTPAAVLHCAERRTVQLVELQHQRGAWQLGRKSAPELSFCRTSGSVTPCRLWLKLIPNYNVCRMVSFCRGACKFLALAMFSPNVWKTSLCQVACQKIGEDRPTDIKIWLCP